MAKKKAVSKKPKKRHAKKSPKLEAESLTYTTHNKKLGIKILIVSLFLVLLVVLLVYHLSKETAGEKEVIEKEAVEVAEIGVVEEEGAEAEVIKEEEVEVEIPPPPEGGIAAPDEGVAIEWTPEIGEREGIPPPEE